MSTVCRFSRAAGLCGVGAPDYAKSKRGMHQPTFCTVSVDLLSESKEKPFRPANVAEPIRVFVLHDFAYELRAALAEPLERFVDIVHGEHDA